MLRYPRNLSGYGRETPDPAWPAAARIAVQFVVNYEEGGENCLLHGDAASEAFLSEIVGAQPWPGQRHWNMESLYDYGARAGFWRVFRLFQEFGLKPTVYGVATALARSPEQVAAMKEAGWEIASHGLKWVEHKDMDEAKERAAIAEAIRLHTEVVGAPPEGWYTGRCSVNTLRLVAETGQMAYVSDTYDDDLPYWARIGDRDQLDHPLHPRRQRHALCHPPGVQHRRPLLHLPKGQLRRALRRGHGGGAEDDEHRAAQPADRPAGPDRRRCAGSWTTPPDTKASGSRAGSRSRGTGRTTHPPVGRLRPSEMSASDFVAKFGGVFEHSPWIAEGAFALELGQAHDSAAGIHNALARVFRSASPDRRLQVLLAHPDLAGKLAAAERLTEESTAEQASAGLDALTDTERVVFTQANAAYRAKHGFPFIIAVRDHDKTGILRAFERRLANDRDTEFAEACAQVERIAMLRLEAML